MPPSPAKMRLWSAILLALLSSSSSSSSSSLDSPVDKSGWVDPHDMGAARPMAPSQMLKAASKKSNKEEDGVKVEEVDARTFAASMGAKLAEVSKCGDTVRELEECRKRLKQQGEEFRRWRKEQEEDEGQGCPPCQREDEDGEGESESDEDAALFFLKR